MVVRMSERLVFDTHRFVRDLVSAGMAESIAETLAEKQVELLSVRLPAFSATSTPSPTATLLYWLNPSLFSPVSPADRSIHPEHTLLLPNPWPWPIPAERR